MLYSDAYLGLRDKPKCNHRKKHTTKQYYRYDKGLSLLLRGFFFFFTLLLGQLIPFELCQIGRLAILRLFLPRFGPSLFPLFLVLPALELDRLTRRGVLLVYATVITEIHADNGGVVFHHFGEF